MKWQGRTGSRNVLDRRTTGGKAAIGGIGIVVLIAYTLLTGDPSMLIGNLLGGGTGNTARTAHQKKHWVSLLQLY